MSKKKIIKTICLKLFTKTVKVEPRVIHTKTKIIQGPPVFDMSESAAKEMGLSKKEAREYIHEINKKFQDDWKKQQKEHKKKKK